MNRPRKLVVAGLILDGDGRVLITQRRSDQAMPLQWEFPGGKIEEGESPTVALARELAEEIDCQVKVGRIWEVLFHRYPDFDLLMMVYLCELEGGADPRPAEVAEVQWLQPEALRSYDILPADEPLIARLEREGTPTFVA
jgi:8-oxo-dGTP diphosphatase